LDTNLKDDKELDMSVKNAEEGGNKFKVNLPATTWGTLLMILILTIVSVGSYLPLKNLIINYEPFTDGILYGDVIRHEIILILSIGAVSVFLLTVLTFAVPYAYQNRRGSSSFSIRYILKLSFCFG